MKPRWNARKVALWAGAIGAVLAIANPGLWDDFARANTDAALNGVILRIVGAGVFVGAIVWGICALRNRLVK